jgi:hypothetical protein
MAGIGKGDGSPDFFAGIDMVAWSAAIIMIASMFVILLGGAHV